MPCAKTTGARRRHDHSLLIEGGPKHVEQVLKLLETLGTAGNLVSDAQMAALALECDAVLHTGDSDFMRFRGLRWFNPLTGMGSARLRQAESGQSKS